MISKSEQIRQALNSGDDMAALRIAARFTDRSAETRLYQRAMSAVNHPGTYRQLGMDADALRRDAVAALRLRFT